ncbi:MAG: C_GCAxxG_C_C family protein [Calditrichaeota bacterium]|nr:MAG: C_GCAxxG_C_C family protein [Calditrichota bacterium]
MQNPKIQAAFKKAFTLYEGKETPHRSCGICLAETFNLETKPYQSLRKGGITGEGQCGAIKAGELVLGEIFGDPSPTGKVTQKLQKAILRFNELYKQELDFGNSESIICNSLTGQFAEFHSTERHSFCTNLASGVAKIIAQILDEFGEDFEIKPIK